VDIYSNEIETAPNVGNDETARYIEGVVSRGEELLILVDLNKLLTDDEWAEMNAF
jgi:purine-binding chemotaxis protein CheW